MLRAGGTKRASEPADQAEAATSEAATSEAATSEDAKRYRSTIDEAAEEFVCPISLNVPIDPVMAEDGRIYERDAIDSWIITRQRSLQQLKSPVTNEPMGARLVPAVQARNAITRMVESGAITGPKADAWNARMEEQKQMAQLRQKAEGGDADAMWRLSEEYRRSAKRGGPQTLAALEEALSWAKKSADLGDPTGMAVYAASLLLADGTIRDEPRALIYLGCGAAKGSEEACYMLGFLHQHQAAGLKADRQDIAMWFQKMATCPIRDAPQSARDKAAAWLSEGSSSPPSASGSSHSSTAPASSPFAWWDGERRAARRN